MNMRSLIKVVFTGPSCCVVGSRAAEAESITTRSNFRHHIVIPKKNTTIIMSESATEKKGKFEPKNPVKLDPPKDDPIAADQLAKCDGRQHHSQMPMT